MTEEFEAVQSRPSRLNPMPGFEVSHRIHNLLRGVDLGLAEQIRDEVLELENALNELRDWKESDTEARRLADLYESKFRYLSSLIGTIFYTSEEAPTNPIQVLDGFNSWLAKAVSGVKVQTRQNGELVYRVLKPGEVKAMRLAQDVLESVVRGEAL